MIGNVGCSITGIEGHYAENITLDNIRLHFVGGGSKERATREVPENEASYPSGRMFGPLPAYGFYCRHVKNLRLHNLDLDFDKPDHRPAIVCDDVLDLDLAGLQAAVSEEADSVVRLKNVQGALIHANRAPRPVTTMLRVEGDVTRDITVLGQRFSSSQAGRLPR